MKWLQRIITTKKAFIEFNAQIASSKRMLSHPAVHSRLTNKEIYI